MFVRSDASLFRSLTTLGQKAGVPREHLARLVVKELADNALDAGAKCKVGDMHNGWYYVEDDGPGIDGDDAEIASLFSFGRPLTSSKLFRLPTRGALGNGLRVVAGAVLASGGELRVGTRDRWLQLTPRDNGSTDHERITGQNLKTGTRVEVKFGADLADDEYTLILAEMAVEMRGDSAYSGKTSPWWYGDEDFFELLMAAPGTVGELLTGKMDGYKNGAYPADADKEASTLSRSTASLLLAGLRATTKEIRPERLGLIGEFGNVHGYAKDKGYFELPTAHRVRARLPFVVEVWADRREKDENPEVQFYVNRTPISAKASCWIDKARTGINGCGLSMYMKTGRAPMKFFINVQTPFMPITTDGKEPNFKPLKDEMAGAIIKAARRARKTTSPGRASLSKKDIVISVLPEAIAKASGDDAHRFSLRQLFYAVRPLFQDISGTDELDYNHFASIITAYEQDLGHDVPKMYRDARGTLYHPHTGETIPLGTLNVERYKRPEWTFNKVLYCEKEGFFPLLLDEQWAEKHDCALLSSKGFASRAARDVIDLLGDDDRELLFFAIHDADGPGTKILEALQEATKARPARRVTIVDLGLNPWEGVAMHLETENVERKSGRVPVARYVRDYDGDSKDWEEWLQTKRIELNAMSSPAFLRWLDRKMAEHDQGKVIPPDEILGEKLKEAASKEVRDRMVARILEEQDVNAQVDAAIEKVPAMALTKLREKIEEQLTIKPEELWSSPLGRIAAKLADTATAKSASKTKK